MKSVAQRGIINIMCWQGAAVSPVGFLRILRLYIYLLKNNSHELVIKGQEGACNRWH